MGHYIKATKRILAAATVVAVSFTTCSMSVFAADNEEGNTIEENPSNSEIDVNFGTVKHNYGTVEGNSAPTESNPNGGTVETNCDGGVVVENNGTVGNCKNSSI